MIRWELAVLDIAGIALAKANTVVMKSRFVELPL